MTARRKVLVAGASGLVGHAALHAFLADGGWDVVGVSRRLPDDVPGAALVAADLTDPAACRAALAEHPDVTHLVYAALHELPGRLFEGWQAREQMERNDAMLRTLFAAVAEAAPGLEHVSLLQGLKAYGTHTGEHPLRVPFVERAPRVEHPNFYWLQEDFLRERKAELGFGLTVWRPHIVFGPDLGNNMNPMAALGAYAAVLRADGEPLHIPWGEATVFQAVDTELLAQALVWAASSPAARDETFNIANGDVFTIREVWPAIAEAMGMEVGEDRPGTLAGELDARSATWTELVGRHGLRAPAELGAYLGQSADYCDGLFGDAWPPLLMSTVKLWQAGFHGWADTELMFRRHLARMQADGLLPPA